MQTQHTTLKEAVAAGQRWRRTSARTKQRHAQELGYCCLQAEAALLEGTVDGSRAYGRSRLHAAWDSAGFEEQVESAGWRRSRWESAGWGRGRWEINWMEW